MTSKLAYRLTYFDIKGLGEPIRFMLKYGKIPFEDRRFTHEEWPGVKNCEEFELIFI